jgi:hypothetical protein
MLVNTAINELIINNWEIFQACSSVHNTDTSNKHHLHRPNASLSCFQKSTVYGGVKIFNTLPPRVEIVKNDMAKFKTALRKNYIHIHFTL